MENNPTPDDAVHLLDDIDYSYVQPSANVRFANLLIDRLFLYALWRTLLYLIAYPVGIVVYAIAGNDKWGVYAVSYFLAAIFYTIYYWAFEATTGGKTLGKFITRTRAVTADGQRMSPRTAWVRSLCRLIPFDGFSALGKPSYPWHDRFSKTLVVDETRTQLPPWD